MMRVSGICLTGAAALGLATLLALRIGASDLSNATVWKALTAFDATEYSHYIIRQQRLPQVMIAGVVGAALAVSGAVLQGLMRNPLAAPSILGITSGATLFTVIFGFALGVPLLWQGPVAFAGGMFGFASALALSQLVGGDNDPRGLSLILSGALVSMFYSALAHAVLLSDPVLRQAALGWVTGNVNFAYADRLWVMAPVALLSVTVLWALSRPATLLTLGTDVAAATGVAAGRLWWLVAGLVALAASAAVAICGPVGFVGLVVPHIVRPLVGADFRKLIPASAFCGATLIVLADLVARTVFAPSVIHTGVVMDLLGGAVFVWLVRRVYLRPLAQEA